jgi:hypothetical protein
MGSVRLADVAKLSYGLPALGLALLALFDKLEVTTPSVEQRVWFGAIVALGGLAAAGGVIVALRRGRRDDGRAKRLALAGLAVNTLVLLLMSTALLAGLDEQETRDLEATKMKQLGQAAAHESAGWVGGGEVHGAQIFAFEIDPAGPLGQLFRSGLALPCQVLGLRIDNSRGAATLTLDLSAPVLTRTDGSHPNQPLARSNVLASATHGRDELMAGHAAPYRVAPGERRTNGLLFLPAEEATQSLASVTVLVNGEPVRLAGRYLSAGDKARLSAVANGGRPAVGGPLHPAP